MTREQEIIQEFVLRTDEIIKESIKKHPRFVERRVGFIDGAQWADANPQFSKEEFIEKVRNWLEKHAYDDKYWTPDGDDLFLGNLIGDICKYLEE